MKTKNSKTITLKAKLEKTTTSKDVSFKTTNKDPQPNQKTEEAICEIDDLITKNDSSDQMTVEELFEDLGI
jgi:hypothetical protein